MTATASHERGGREHATLAGEAAAFRRFASPRLLVVLLVLLVATRVAFGGWRWPDAIVAAVILGLEPFTEWVTHVFLLHAKPRTILGRRVDPLAARKHREHHADPFDRALVFIPLGVLIPNLLGGVALYAAILRNVHLVLTAMTTSVAMLLTYEWTHHLIHSPYLPRRRVYRYVWRAHRLHHFRNEHYWFGVTIHLADHALGTFPDKDAVELSPTCRTLGVEAA